MIMPISLLVLVLLFIIIIIPNRLDLAIHMAPPYFDSLLPKKIKRRLFLKTLNGNLVKKKWLGPFRSRYPPPLMMEGGVKIPKTKKQKTKKQKQKSQSWLLLPYMEIF